MTLDCVVVDLAVNGARVQLDAPLGSARPCLGQQILLKPPGRAPLAALLRWADDRDFGVQFLTPMSPDMLTAIERSQGHVCRPRPGRARIVMPAEIHVQEMRFPAVVANISCGGALVECAASLQLGAPVMLHSDIIRPIAGHVRWWTKDRGGVMFNRLLPVASAEAIAEAFGVSPIWVEEVQTYHRGIAFDNRYGAPADS